MKSVTTQRPGLISALPQRHQSGVTLIEVLVSMLIMALGMVSLAALQTYTLRYQLGSAQRAQLSGLLSDYAERVRSNLVQASTGPSYLVAGKWEDQIKEAPPAASKNCAEVICSTVELAEFDMAQWRGAVRQQLPQGSAFVTGSAATGLLVTFMWSDKDFVDGVAAGARSSDTCGGTETGLNAQTCCPEAVSALDGVRCANFTVIP